MQKVSKADADYSSKSDNPRTVCSACKHYKGAGRCEKVEGTVAPGGWCRFFATGLRSMARRGA